MVDARRLRATSLGLAAAALSAWVAPVAAQTTTAGQSPADRIPPVTSSAPLDLNTPGSCPFAAPGLRTTLTRVRVEGATVVSQEEIDAAVAPLLGRESGLEIICEARDTVAQLFETRGFRLTRVDVPPQRLTDGELTLLATEGYVVSADLDGLAPMGPSASKAEQYFRGIGTARPTPWSRIERAVFLAQDIPGAELTVKLTAAPGDPGAVRLEATSTGRRRFDLTVGAQHLGSEELGETAAFVRLDANGFTAFAERTSLVLYATENGAQQVIEGVESIALGGSGLRAELDLTYARTRPEGVLSPLEIEGDFFSAKLGAQYPFIRGQSLTVRGEAFLEYLDQENSLGAFQVPGGGAPVLFDDKLRILSVRAETRWSPDDSPFTVQARGEVRQGLGFLGASEAGDFNLSRATGDPEATVARGDVEGLWSLREDQSGPWIKTIVQGQWASDALLAYEEFQIGNFTVGRGYDPGSASGDKAWAVQVDAGWSVPSPFWSAVITPYAFYDYANLTNEDLGGYEAEVSSFGFGVSAEVRRKFKLDVTWAMPQQTPFPGAPDPEDRLLVKLSYTRSFR